MNVEFLRMGGDPILSICTVLAKTQAVGCNFHYEEKMEAVLCLLKSVIIAWILWLAFPSPPTSPHLVLQVSWQNVTHGHKI